MMMDKDLKEKLEMKEHVPVPINERVNHALSRTAHFPRKRTVSCACAITQSLISSCVAQGSRIDNDLALVFCVTEKVFCGHDGL